LQHKEEEEGDGVAAVAFFMELRCSYTAERRRQRQLPSPSLLPCSSAVTQRSKKNTKKATVLLSSPSSQHYNAALQRSAAKRNIRRR